MDILRSIGGMVCLMDLVVALVFLAFSCGDASFGINKTKDIDHHSNNALNDGDLNRIEYALRISRGTFGHCVHHIIYIPI